MGVDHQARGLVVTALAAVRRTIAARGPWQERADQGDWPGGCGCHGSKLPQTAGHQAHCPSGVMDRLKESIRSRERERFRELASATAGRVEAEAGVSSSNQNAWPVWGRRGSLSGGPDQRQEVAFTLLLRALSCPGGSARAVEAGVSNGQRKAREGAR